MLRYWKQAYNPTALIENEAKTSSSTFGTAKRPSSHHRDEFIHAGISLACLGNKWPML